MSRYLCSYGQFEREAALSRAVLEPGYVYPLRCEADAEIKGLPSGIERRPRRWKPPLTPSRPAPGWGGTFSATERARDVAFGPSIGIR